MVNTLLAIGPVLLIDKIFLYGVSDHVQYSSVALSR